MFNFALTIMLLIFGAFNVFGNLHDYLDPGTLANAVLEELHASSPRFPVVVYTPTSLTATVGAVMLTLQGANFGFIAWWSIARLRARKFSFWVPMVGAAISSTLIFVTLVIVMSADPEVVAAIIKFTTG
jgi:hypothetical protein